MGENMFLIVRKLLLYVRANTDISSGLGTSFPEYIAYIYLPIMKNTPGDKVLFMFLISRFFIVQCARALKHTKICHTIGHKIGHKKKYVNYYLKNFQINGRSCSLIRFFVEYSLENGHVLG